MAPGKAIGPKVAKIPHEIEVFGGRDKVIRRSGIMCKALSHVIFIFQIFSKLILSIKVKII